MNELVRQAFESTPRGVIVDSAAHPRFHYVELCFYVLRHPAAVDARGGIRLCMN